MWVPPPPGASAPETRYNRSTVLSRIHRSIALKMVLASALPSAVVLLAGLGALVAHSHQLAQRDMALAFHELWQGAVLGTLLALTFAGMTIALAAPRPEQPPRAAPPPLPGQAHPASATDHGPSGVGRIPGARPRAERRRAGQALEELQHHARARHRHGGGGHRDARVDGPDGARAVAAGGAEGAQRPARRAPGGDRAPARSVEGGVGHPGPARAARASRTGGLLPPGDERVLRDAAGRGLAPAGRRSGGGRGPAQRPRDALPSGRRSGGRSGGAGPDHLRARHLEGCALP